VAEEQLWASKTGEPKFGDGVVEAVEVTAFGLTRGHFPIRAFPNVQD
jgi:hypothetical protein